MLKLEPKEADQLPVPAPAVVMAAADHLSAVRTRVAGLLRNGALTEAVALVDDVLLVGELGMAPVEVGLLRTAHLELSARRKARGGNARVHA